MRYVRQARIDGMSEYGIYAKIMLPLSKPVIATLTIFSFTTIWNDFMGPLIYINSQNLKTIQLGLEKLYNGVFFRVFFNYGGICSRFNSSINCFCMSTEILCGRYRINRIKGLMAVRSMDEKKDCK